MEDNKLAPYQRLKAIVSGNDVIMTDRSLKNLDSLLGENKDKKINIWSRIIKTLKYIDSKIFSNSTNIYSNKYIKRRNRK
jgi:hypothetical protein